MHGAQVLKDIKAYFPSGLTVEVGLPGARSRVYGMHSPPRSLAPAMPRAGLIRLPLHRERAVVIDPALAAIPAMDTTGDATGDATGDTDDKAEGALASGTALSTESQPDEAKVAVEYANGRREVGALLLPLPLPRDPTRHHSLLGLGSWCRSAMSGTSWRAASAWTPYGCSCEPTPAALKAIVVLGLFRCSDGSP